MIFNSLVSKLLAAASNTMQTGTPVCCLSLLTVDTDCPIQTMATVDPFLPVPNVQKNPENKSRGD